MTHKFVCTCTCTLSIAPLSVKQKLEECLINIAKDIMGEYLLRGYSSKHVVLTSVMYFIVGASVCEFVYA